MLADYFEDGSGSQLILDLNRLIFSFKADVDVAEVKCLFKEDTPRFDDLTLTSEFFISTIFNFQSQDVFVNFGPRREESDFNFTAFPWGYFISFRVWNEDFTAVLPSELSWGVSMVCHHNLLSEKHLDTVIRELELKHLFGQLKGDWISLSLY